MNTSRSFRTLGACALLGLGATLGGIELAAASDLPPIKVSYQDLDLNSPADARVLYARLQHAAEKVCPSAPSADLQSHAAYQRCVRVALDDAVRQVRSPELLALHHAAADARDRS